MGRLYLQLFVGGQQSYLRYLCLFAHSGVQHILCCFVVNFSGLSFIVLPLRYSLTFIYLCFYWRYSLTMNTFIIGTEEENKQLKINNLLDKISSSVTHGWFWYVPLSPSPVGQMACKHSYSWIIHRSSHYKLPMRFNQSNRSFHNEFG